MEKEQQELIFKLSLYEQQIQQLQQQLQIIEQEIIELSSLDIGLDNLKDCKDKEIFASISKGIFAKGKLISDYLVVDVGSKNFVKKSVPETQKIIKEQLIKLEDVRIELNENLERISVEINKIIMEAQEKEGKDKFI